LRICVLQFLIGPQPPWPGRHGGYARGGRADHRRRRVPRIRSLRLQSREITLTATFRYANTYPTAIQLVAGGRVDVEAIVTGHFSLDDAERALQAGRQDPRSVKAVVVPA
jgi:threonine dehydrogenase-like Zn-dependent dehydrogenase